MKISKNQICNYIPICFTIFYSFFFGLKLKIFGNTLVIFASFAICMVFLLMSNVRMKKRNPLNYICIICIAVILFNRNQRFSAGNYLFDITLAFMFIQFLFYKGNCFWHELVFKLFRFMAWFYAISTIFLYLNTDIYVNYVAPLFGGNYMLSMLRKARMGYAVGFANHYSTTVMYLSTAIGAPISMIMRKEFIRKKKVQYLLIALCYVAILLTGKRAPTIFVLVSAVLCFYIINSEKKLGRIFKITFGLILIFTIYMVAASLYAPLQNVITRFFYTSSSGDVTLGRLDMITSALNVFKENPLLGVGWGGFSYATEADVANAHNVFIQLLCDNGIVLGIPFFAFFIIAIYHAVLIGVKCAKRHREVDKKILIAISFSLYIQIYFLMYCLTGNPLYDIQMLCPYILACSISEYYFENINSIFSISTNG